MTNDRQLVTQCLQGEHDAFEELVTRYQERLYAAVSRMVDNKEDAIDVVQDTLTNAFAALQTFRGESEWYTWLYRIAVNSAINVRRKRLLLVSLGAGDSERGWIDPPDSSPTNYPSYQLERFEEDRLVQEALDRLPREFRIAFLLKEIEGLTYDEIADLLQVPVGTIRSRLSRARTKLRQWLSATDGNLNLKTNI